MESVGFTAKLSDVFDFLLTLQNPVTDDTCLQRLQDIIREKFPNGGCPGVDQFLARASDRLDTLEPSVIGFALYLSGQTAVNGNICPGTNTLFETLSDKDLWKEPSIGTAYFDSLSVIVKTEHGWTWIRENKSDFLAQALSSLEEKKSLFLHTSARRFLVTVYDECYHDNSGPTGISVTSIYQKLADDFLQELHKVTVFPARGMPVYLQNVMQVLTSSQHLPQEVDEEQVEKVLHNLLKLSLSGKLASSSLCEDLLYHWLTLTHKRDPKSFGVFLNNEFLPVCNLDWENVDVCKFHKMAAMMHQRYRYIDESEVLENVVMTPYWIETVGETVPESVPDKCVDAFKKAVPTTGVFMKLMHQTASWLLENRDIEIMSHILKHIYDHWRDIVDPRLLLCLFEGIAEEIKTDPRLELELILDTIDLVLMFISGIHTHNGVLEKGLDSLVAMLQWMACHPDRAERIESCLPSVAEHLERCLVGTKWEHRDTAVESVSKLLYALEDHEVAMSVLMPTRVLVSAWQCVTDSDSYVRASSARLVRTLVSVSNVWDSFLSQLGQKQEDLIDKLGEIVSTDTEAFPRRAAVVSLLAIYTHTPLEQSVKRKIASLMLKAMSDFDWEVKANALDFWQHVVEDHYSNSSIPQYAADLVPAGAKRKSEAEGSNLDKLNETGLFTALVTGVEDYDQHVCEKTYKILKNLKQKIDFNELSDSEQKRMKCQNGEPAVSSQDSEGRLADADGKCMKTIVEILRDTDIEEKLSVVSSSVDEYSRNPIALLEDFLSEDKDIENDKFVDCY